MKRSIVLTLSTLLLITLTVAQHSKPTKLSLSNKSDSEFSPAVVNCDCYYSTDCKGRSALCRLGDGCLPQGKNDGRCDLTAAPENGSAVSSNTAKEQNVIERRAIASALDAYFQSFIKVTEKGGGRPDASFLQSALTVPLSKATHERVEEAVWVSLDALIGWDFQYPTNTQRAQGFFGNIREVHGVHSAGGIIDAARKGLLNALTDGIADKVSAPFCSTQRK